VEVNWETVEAFTIDKLIGLRPWNEPEYNEKNQLKYKYILIDETSMVDERKLYFLLKAIPESTSLVLIWDPNQLPPVDVGSPFADLIKSEVLNDNTILLTKIKRQSWISEYEEMEKWINNIVYNSSKILDWKLPINNNTDNVIRYFDDSWSSESIQTNIFDTLFKNMKYLEWLWVDLIKDWEILVPTYKGTTWIININNEISKYLLPNAKNYNIRWREFRQWDKVVYQWSPYEWLVKWDIWIIKTYNNLEKELIIDFFWIWEKNITLDRVMDISLWYAISIHRSQWNEWKFCTMILTFWAFQLLNKELLYTWYTRAKKRVFLFWEKRAVSMALQKSIWQKNTYLFNHLREVPDENIKILIDRDVSWISDNERRFAQRNLNSTYNQDDWRLLKIKTNQKNSFRYIWWDSKYLHSIWISEMCFLWDDEFNKLKNNDDIIILSLIKNTLNEMITSENIIKLINNRNKNLVEVNSNFNIWIIDRLGKKFFYNKSKVKFVK
jgi:ATP-dependent exoDNAse (exonuclease V) alpha subunit